MEFKKVLERRRSVRDFDGTPIPEETIRSIIKQAGRAPSWANAQPWRVYVATGKTLARIRDRHIDRVSRGMQGESDFENMHRGDWGAQAQRNMSGWSQDIFYRYLKGDPAETFATANAQLFNASAVAYLTIERPYPDWSVLDLGAFEQTLALAATNVGIDSMIAYEFVKFPDIVRKEMEIPHNEVLAIGMGLGYATDKPINGYRSPRMKVDEYLTIKG